MGQGLLLLLLLVVSLLLSLLAWYQSTSNRSEGGDALIRNSESWTEIL